MPLSTPTEPVQTATVYISIGNSDDRLRQREWAAFLLHTHLTINDTATVIHGAWYSAPGVEWQNACWCAEIPLNLVSLLKDKLRALAGEFRQDSIAWAETPTTEFLAP